MSAASRPPTASPRARAVADAVLYEGYVLYPYRASAAQEPAALAVRRARAPAVRRGRRLRAVVDAHRVLVEPGRAAAARTSGSAACRCSTARSRRPTAATVRRRSAALDVDGVDVGRRGTRRSSTRSTSRRMPLLPARRRAADDRRSSSPAGDEIETLRRATARCVVGRVVRRREAGRRPCAGRRRLGRRRRARCVKVAVDVENTTDWSRPGAPRDEMRAALARRGAHAARRRRRRVRLAARPARDAAAAVAGCRNDGTFPVLVGADGDRRRAVVADHPLRPPGGRAREPRRPLRRHRDRRDPRPAGAHAHRRGEGRGPGHRPAGRGDRRPLRRHAARGVGAAARRDPRRWRRSPRRPDAAPDADAGARGGTRASTRAVDPWTDTRRRSAVSRSARARRCGCARRRRADAHDLFLAGLIATVAGVFRDVDGDEHLAVTARRRPGDRGARLAGPVPLLPPRRGRAAQRVGR